uniref:Uncharacterized protein n=1 Tax=viral metagenome TaxID=1070528 RepID=A0A6C0IVS8_9ZZZZ
MISSKYPLLTINNITKICDDKIYTFQNKPIKYQWFTPQLLYVLDILKIPKKDPITGLFLTRITILKVLNDINIETIDVSSNSKESDIKMGILPIKKLNIVSDNNLGGKVDLEKVTFDYIVKNMKYTYIDQKTAKTFKIKKDLDKWLIKKTKRVEKAYEVINSYDNFLNFGRIEWYNNSCYADSIIFLFLIPIFETGLSDFITNNFLDKNISLGELSTSQISQNKCLEGAPEQSIKILNNIYTSFNTLNKKLLSNEIINSFKFLKQLTHCKKKTNNLNFVNNTMNDTLEFMSILFNVFRIDYSDCNRFTSYKFIDENPKKYTSSLDDMFINPVIENDFKEVTYYDKNIIFKHVYNFDLTNLLNMNLNDGINHFIYDTLEQIKKPNYYYDTTLELWFPKKKKALYNIMKNKKLIPISKFIRYKQELYPEDSYHLYEGYKKITEEGVDFVVSIDGKEKIKIDDLPPINNKAIRIFKYVNECIVDNAETLFFGIHRKKQVLDKDKNLRNVFIPIKILPIETIILNSKTLFLRGIIVWYNNHYITFFCKDNLWYKYDDNFNFTITDDYIDYIGSLEDLISYQIDSFKNIVLTNSILYWYNI